MVNAEDEDPFALFAAWFAEAKARETGDATAMALATAGAEGAPSVRMVLLKDADARGFTFYTNTESRKAGEMAANPRAALCFHWTVLKRQVRVEGRIEQVSAEEADAYFASRARGSQLGAWASEQSRPMAHRFDLEKRVARFTAKFGLGAVPRPPFWTGFRVVPHVIEFWREMPFRLHDRVRYARAAAGAGWTQERLYP